MVHQVEAKIGGKTITFETGKMAKQAGGAVTVRCGDTIVLVTATISPEPREGIDFLPLTVDYQEKTYAAGKIPGGFFKREGRPSARETLTSRFIDRPIRPLFPKNYHNETQVIAFVISADEENEADVLAMTGASAALMLSGAPFEGPIAGVCVGRVDGKLIANPTAEELEKSDFDVIVAASKDSVVMVEGSAQEVPEEDLAAAIKFAHESVQDLLKVQQDLAEKIGKPRFEVAPAVEDEGLKAEVESFLSSKIKQAVQVADKQERRDALSNLKEELLNQVARKEGLSDEDLGRNEGFVKRYFEQANKKAVREMILNESRRIDGRGLADIRPITCEIGMLPRAHGSALFTRGETQALVTTTLGSSDDMQRVEALTDSYHKHFMLHYNFPPFSTGEVKMMRSAGRREIGHGALAERAVEPMLPDHQDFPYTIRIVSDILESNGSSSMASVCGAILSLMDAGVKIKSPVAGIAMGLIQEGDNSAVLSDILGDEDHLGDMDFKVTGTREGVTALQMDIKIKGLSQELLIKALEQAKTGRLHILDKMEEAIKAPRETLSEYAPKITSLQIKQEKIGMVIGPGGKNIRAIIEETGAKVDIEDDGMVYIFAADQESGDAAIKRIKDITAEPEVGKIYSGVVKKVVEFGAFVEYMPGQEGLVHISQLENARVKAVTDVVNEGDEVVVKLLEVDDRGRVRLSRKEALGHESEV